jgi:hypothetical protein
VKSKENYRMRAFGNMVLRRALPPKRDEIMGDKKTA